MPDEPLITQQAQGSYIAQATHGGTATVQVVLPPAPVRDQNRVRMLSRLRYRYDEQWEQSLEGAGLLTLGLVSKPDAVLHHTGLLFLSPQQPERSLPPGTPIAQMYDQAGQDLLILGEPGAGKSTLLLDLARQLVERAEQDAAQPLPVIFPLATWAVKRQPLTDWLSEQLTQLYDVPRRLSHSWVQTDQLLLLLDGFDEVPQEARVACIQAIAAYREEHLVPIVVCSRRTEFEEIPRQQRLVMQSAVVVQPLTQEQVGAYLLQGGEAFSALRTVLHSNPVLAELVTTPLMLNILTLTYTGSKARDLPQGGSPEEQQRRIFATYIERMIERRRNRISFPLQRIVPWLSWLARQMQQRHQTVFYLEHLQADWLGERRSRLLYRLTVGLFVGLFAVLVNKLSSPVGTLVVVLVFGLFGVPTFQLSWLAAGLPSIEVVVLVAGLVYGLGQIQPRETLTRSRRRKKRSIVVGLSIVLIAWLLYGLLYGLFVVPVVRLLYGLLYGLFVVLVAGLFGGLVYGLGQIQPREALTRSWRGTKRSIVVGLVVGLSVGLVAGLVTTLVAGLVTTLVAGLVTTLVAGFSTSQLDDRLRLTPNQGIWRSARDGLIVGLSVGLVVELVVVLITTLVGGPFVGSELFVVQSVALVAGLITTLSFGLGAFFQHFALRFWLWRGDSLPWNVVAFLDEAAGCILLRKVGGGYMFMHRLILDYFASLDNPLTKPELPPPSQVVPPRICSACGYQEVHPGARFCASCGTSLAS
jgi:eukaryotic-like serine/threonine-protein kinase